MDLVHSLAPRTLLSKAKTWYVGANVQGKAPGLTMFTGGFQKYREHCLAAIHKGFSGYHFAQKRERERAADASATVENATH